MLDRGWRIEYDPAFTVRHYADPRGRLDLSNRRHVELRNAALITYRRFPIGLALPFIGARAVTMAAKTRREGGDPVAILRALPEARKQWRDQAMRRDPIGLRGVTGYFAGHRASTPHDQVTLKARCRSSRVDVLGCELDPFSLDDTVDAIRRSVVTGPWLHVATANVDFVMLARRDPGFREDLERADLVVADGVPLLWAASLMGHALKGRVNGTDLVLRLPRVSADTGCTIAIVGGRYEVTARAAHALRTATPGARVVAVATPIPLDHESSMRIAAEVKATDAGIVLVALGAPAQERWLQTYGRLTGATVGIGVGSAFDIISGDKPRASRFVREHGFEWLHRLRLEPQRLARRYLIDDTPFVALVAAEALRRRIGLGAT